MTTFADLKMPAEVIEQLKSIASELQSPAGSGPSVVQFVSNSPSNTHAAAEALANALNKSLVHVDSQSAIASSTAGLGVNLEALQTFVEPEVILFFDEADSLFGKRTTIRDDRKFEVEQEASLIDQELPFQGLCILSTRVESALAVKNLRFTVHLPHDPS